MAGRRSGGFRHGHDQLEELRNLQENISRERQEWDKKKEEERLDLQKEREALGRERRRLEEEKGGTKTFAQGHGTLESGPELSLQRATSALE